MNAAGVCAVVLAAGESTRFDGIKLLATIGGVSLLRHAVDVARNAADEVLVVTGAHAAQLQSELHALAVPALHNRDWPLGMGESIGFAFRSLIQRHPPPKAALVCLADQPRVTDADLQQLITQWQQHPACIVAADHGARLGPPCVFPQRCFEELAALSGPRGAQGLLRREAGQLIRVSMPQAAVDVDTREDLARLADRA